MNKFLAYRKVQQYITGTNGRHYDHIFSSQKGPAISTHEITNMASNMYAYSYDIRRELMHKIKCPLIAECNESFKFLTGPLGQQYISN